MFFSMFYDVAKKIIIAYTRITACLEKKTGNNHRKKMSRSSSQLQISVLLTHQSNPIHRWQSFHSSVVSNHTKHFFASQPVIILSTFFSLYIEVDKLSEAMLITTAIIIIIGYPLKKQQQAKLNSLKKFAKRNPRKLHRQITRKT